MVDVELMFVAFPSFSITDRSWLRFWLREFDSEDFVLSPVDQVCSLVQHFLYFCPLLDLQPGSTYVPARHTFLVHYDLNS